MNEVVKVEPLEVNRRGFVSGIVAAGAGAALGVPLDGDVGAALAADVWPCARILFEPMPRLMLYGDTTRLGPKRPFAKDPTVIRHDGRYFMYYSECAYARNRIPKGMPKYRTGWWGAIATSTNLVDWSRVDQCGGRAEDGRMVRSERQEV